MLGLSMPMPKAFVETNTGAWLALNRAELSDFRRDQSLARIPFGAEPENTTGGAPVAGASTLETSSTPRFPFTTWVKTMPLDVSSPREEKNVLPCRLNSEGSER